MSRYCHAPRRFHPRTGVENGRASDSAIRKIISAYDRYVVDGLIAKKGPGRKHLISEAQKEIPEEFHEQGRAQRTF
jgi:hypothetical protein